MTDSKVGQTKAYAPVGFCIYCGVSGDQVALEDEHIIPYAIRGAMILPRASCRKCADKINREFEQYCLREMFLVPRAHFKMKGRRRGTKKRPLPNQFNLERPHGVVATPLHEYPHILTLLAFERAGLIRGGAPTEKYTFRAYSVVRNSHMERLSKEGDWAFQSPFSPDRFSRFVAKIAHCIAVAELGWREFMPFLPDIILGKNPCALYFVGCAPGPHTKGPDAHMTRVGTVKLPTGEIFVFANVRFWAQFNTPIYEVIVGSNPTPLALSRLPPADS